MMPRIMIFLFLAGGLYGNIQAQIGTGIPPVTMSDTVIGDSIYDLSVTTIVIPEVEVPDTFGGGGGEDSIVTYDMDFAVIIPADIDFMKKSDVFQFEAGELRLLRIESPGAKSLSLRMDGFWIPPGGTLHIYDRERLNIIGGFTDFNNREDSAFATQVIPGDMIVLEYFAPAGISEKPVILISEVLHDYIGILTAPGDPGLALPCTPDVACEEGDPWRDEIRSVVRITVGKNACSGVLMNNTNQDGMPYMLTALHCVEQPGSNGLIDGIMDNKELTDARSIMVYFNYQAFDCNTADDPEEDHTFVGKNRTIYGGEVVSYNAKTDFVLFRLQDYPPADYAPYYAGWDVTGAAPVVEVAGISHPWGDRKKIALEDDVLESHPDVKLSGVMTHVEASWRAAFNVGHTEFMSSGSPLFEQGGYVVGHLSGGVGDPPCIGQFSSFYAKIANAWNGGTGPSSRLRDWLDPLNTGVSTMTGMDPMCFAGITISDRTYTSGTVDSEKGWERIHTSSSVEIPDEAEVEYAARDNVQLMPGFKVAFGGKFLARVNKQEDCPSHPITAIFGKKNPCRTAGTAYEAKTIFGKPPYTYSWRNNRDSQTGSSNPFTYQVGLFDRWSILDLEVKDAYGQTVTNNKHIYPTSCKNGEEGPYNETVAGSLFQLYPNPTTGVITIASSKEVNARVDVFNVLGAQVTGFSFKGTGSVMDLRPFGTGMYFVNMNAGNTFQSQRIIVE